MAILAVDRLGKSSFGKITTPLGGGKGLFTPSMGNPRFPDPSKSYVSGLFGVRVALLSRFSSRFRAISLEVCRWDFPDLGKWTQCLKLFMDMDYSRFKLEVSPIDTPRQIAQTPILSLTCVDAIRAKGLRAVVDTFAEPISTFLRGCVDLTLETLAPSWLSDELPTDWVKLVRLETQKKRDPVGSLFLPQNRAAA